MGWKKGQSGNPAGRQRKALCLTEQIRMALDKKHDIETRLTNMQVIVSRIIRLATEGNLEAIKIVLDRVEGKVQQPLTLGGEGGGPIVCRWISDGDNGNNSV